MHGTILMEKPRYMERNRLETLDVLLRMNVAYGLETSAYTYWGNNSWACWKNLSLAHSHGCKYFPKWSSLTAIVGTLLFAWRSILHVHDMTKVGVKRELANDVCVTSTFPPKRPKEGYSHYQLRLLMFKEEGSDEWKLPRLRECFDPNECRLIMQVRPGSSDT